MSGAKRVADLLVELSTKVTQLSSTAQLANTTIAGEDAVALTDVVSEAAVTNDAMPGVQEDAADGNEGVSDLQATLSAGDDDLDARLEAAAAALELASAELTDAMQDVSDAFGEQFDGMSEDIQTAIRAAGAAQDTAGGIPLILFSTVRGPSNGSDLAPTGSTWFYLDTSNNIAGQWQQTGPKSTPTWTPRQIVSDVIANLDVGKLTAGQAAIAQLVAQKIAASTANFQTANVSNLFVTSGATMSQAVIDFLFANVVQAKKITAGMIDVDSLSGITLTGTVVQTSATGKRTVLGDNVITFFGSDGTTAVKAGVIEGLPNGASGGMVHIGSAQGAGDGIYIGTRALPVAGSVACYADNAWIPALYVSNVYDASSGKEMVGDTGWTTPTVSNATQDSTNPFRYRRLNGFVVFDGLLTLTSSSIGATLLTLPAGFRPSTARQQYLVRNGGTTPAQWLLRIQAGGAVALPITTSAGGSGSLEMAGITPYPADR